MNAGLISNKASCSRRSGELNNRKFILCIGASKSGSTWFYHFLKNQPNFSAGIRKEYNALNKIFLTKHISITPPMIKELSSLGKKISKLKETLDFMSSSVEKYCEYFDQITLHGGFSADISPSYIGLSNEHINEVAIQLEERGFQVYVVLLLRDPISRIYSFSKMILRNKYLRDYFCVSQSATLNDVALDLAHHREFNSDYKAVIKNIINTRTEIKKFIYPYENLISAAGVEALSLDLNLEPLPDFEKKIFNQGRNLRDEKIELDQTYLRLLLNEQYIYCKNYFKPKDMNWKFL